MQRAASPRNRILSPHLTLWVDVAALRAQDGIPAGLRDEPPVTRVGSTAMVRTAQVRAVARAGRAHGFAARLLVVAAAFAGLTACQSSGVGSIDTAKELNVAAAATPTPNPNGEVQGTGAVRVAMLLPRSAAGNGQAVAAELRNGALLAMQDFGSDTIQIVIKDEAGQAASAQAAANEAVLEGSSAILGPVFSATVSAASAITLPAGRTMIAFSTDATIARRGVYLLSFTPQDDTRRSINFAVAGGRKSILAFLPNNSEGTLREAVFRQTAGAAGANAHVIKYERSGEAIDQAVDQAAALLATVDSFYIPEGGEIPNAIMQSFRKKGVNTLGKLLIGSGAWETVNIADPMLEGAIYPGRDTANFAAFSARYETAYGAKPGVWAGLGYDAVTLSMKLVQQNGAQNAFTAAAIENPRGFSGINGIFRLRSDGTAERGLAIYRVLSGRAEMLSPAPTSFSRASGS